MVDVISENVWKILACSYCGHALTKTPQDVTCSHCGLKYLHVSSGPLDLRLRKQKTYDLAFELNSPLLPESGFAFEPLKMNTAAQVDFTNVGVPRHLSREMMSFFPFKARALDHIPMNGVAASEI